MRNVIVFLLAVTVAPVRVFGCATGAVNVRVITVPAGMVCVVPSRSVTLKIASRFGPGRKGLHYTPDKVAQNADGAISAANSKQVVIVWS
jgi:hypothetical protein